MGMYSMIQQVYDVRMCGQLIFMMQTLTNRVTKFVNNIS